MRQRRASRVLRALLGLWFVLAGQEPPFAHQCHMVGAGSADGVQTAVRRDAHVEAHQEVHEGAPASHDAHGGGHGAHTAHAPVSDAPVDVPAPCQCIGECGAPVPPPLVPLAVLAAFEPPVVLPPALPDYVAQVRAPDAPARTQPFAIGPPRASAAAIS